MTQNRSERDLHSQSLAYQTYLRHDNEEKSHFEDVCLSFRQYAAFAMSQWKNHQLRIQSLPETQDGFNAVPVTFKAFNARDLEISLK